MKLKIALFSFISFIAFIFTASTYAMDSMQMSTTGTGGNMLMTASFQLVENEIPLDNATVILGHQSRVSDRKGVVQFEDVMTGRNTLRVISQGKEQEITVDVKEGTNLVKLENSWKELSFEASPVQTEQSQAQNLLVTMITVLLCWSCNGTHKEKTFACPGQRIQKKKNPKRHNWYFFGIRTHFSQCSWISNDWYCKRWQSGFYSFNNGCRSCLHTRFSNSTTC
jgi:hypothetical protein